MWCVSGSRMFNPIANSNVEKRNSSHLYSVEPATLLAGVEVVTQFSIIQFIFEVKIRMKF